MQKGRVVNLGRLKSVIDFLKTNWCLLTLSISFVLGLLFGTLYSGGNTNFAKLCAKITDSFIELRSSAEFFEIFKDSFLMNSAFLISIFIFGISITGVTLVPIIMFFKGLHFGSLASIIYSDFALKGIAFNALILIPPSVVFVIFLIISSKSAMRLSLSLIAVTLPNNTPKSFSFLFNKYWKQHIILIIPIIIAALMDAWLSVNLISHFDLI